MNILLFLLVVLIAGLVAGLLINGTGLGALGDIGTGSVGALFSGLFFVSHGGQALGFWGEVLAATIGAILVLLAVNIGLAIHAAFETSHRRAKDFHKETRA